MVPHAQPHYDLQLRVLETLASARNYNAWLASLTQPHLGDDPIEIGSGMGDQAALWLEGGVPRITLTDLEPRAIENLSRRFSGDARVAVRQLDLLAAAPGFHSALVAVNVVEHIEDDRAALMGATGLVRPGGRVVVFLPAFPFAMSRFDREIGHFRRYTRDTARTLLDSVGLEPLEVRYLNAPGLVAWLVMMRLLRRRASDDRLVRIWDTAVVPVTRRLEARRHPPFGQSVLAVGIVPGAGPPDHPPSAQRGG